MTAMAAELILASRSASRRAMLDAAGISYCARPAAIDERAIEADMTDAGAGQIALGLARAKALAVAQDQPEALVLGSDSVLTVAGCRFDKPGSREEAADHLRFFSGRTLELHSAAALARGDRCLWDHTAVASLQVLDIDEQFIEWYLDREWPEVGNCVGVFRIEALGVRLFSAIEGDHFTILGMPLLPVLAALREWGEDPR